MTLKGGKMKKGSVLRSAVVQALSPSVTRAGMAVQATIQKASPVKTGTLRRSWTTGSPETSGSIIRVKVGTNVVYARYQDTRTRNRGYIRKGIEAGKMQAVAVVREGLKAVPRDVWDRS